MTTNNPWEPLAEDPRDDIPSASTDGSENENRAVADETQPLTLDITDASGVVVFSVLSSEDIGPFLHLVEEDSLPEALKATIFAIADAEAMAELKATIRPNTKERKAAEEV